MEGVCYWYWQIYQYKIRIEKGKSLTYVDASGFEWDFGAPNAESKLSNGEAESDIHVINHKSKAKDWL